MDDSPSKKVKEEMSKALVHVPKAMPKKSGPSNTMAAAAARRRRRARRDPPPCPPSSTVSRETSSASSGESDTENIRPHSTWLSPNLTSEHPDGFASATDALEELLDNTELCMPGDSYDYPSINHFPATRANTPSGNTSTDDSDSDGSMSDTSYPDLAMQAMRMAADNFGSTSAPNEDRFEEARFRHYRVLDKKLAYRDALQELASNGMEAGLTAAEIGVITADEVDRLVLTSRNEFTVGATQFDRGHEEYCETGGYETDHDADDENEDENVSDVSNENLRGNLCGGPDEVGTEEYRSVPEADQQKNIHGIESRFEISGKQGKSMDEYSDHETEDSAPDHKDASGGGKSRNRVGASGNQHAHQSHASTMPQIVPVHQASLALQAFRNPQSQTFNARQLSYLRGQLVIFDYHKDMVWFREVMDSAGFKQDSIAWTQLLIDLGFTSRFRNVVRDASEHYTAEEGVALILCSYGWSSYMQ
ncbi:hypothetical protein ANO11243_023870 [Dothideomycetidae sp. 11243]|nr:hypothetical protein ANO11243_023870 [fungal sp. No.11243]